MIEDCSICQKGHHSICDYTKWVESYYECPCKLRGHK